MDVEQGEEQGIQQCQFRRKKFGKIHKQNRKTMKSILAVLAALLTTLVAGECPLTQEERYNNDGEQWVSNLEFSCYLTATVKRLYDGNK